MINVYKKTLKSPQIREVKETEQGTWIRVIDPSEEELKLLSENMKLDLSIIEDGLDENEISRLEKEDGALYMIIRFPTKKSFIMTVPILIVITDENIVTICKEKEQLTKYFIEDEDFLTTKKTYFVLKIISEIFKSYDTYLNRMLKDIKLKKIQIDNLKNKDILFLVQEEETLNDFISSLVPAINITEKILRGKYINIYDRDEDIIEDLVLDSKQTLELSRNGLKSIKNIREAYSTILTNDLNRVMKILTITTIILTVPTIISSIFGMNITLPLADNPMAFFYIMSLTIVLSIILLVIIIKRRWI